MKTLGSMVLVALLYSPLCLADLYLYEAISNANNMLMLKGGGSLGYTCARETGGISLGKGLPTAKFKSPEACTQAAFVFSKVSPKNSALIVINSSTLEVEAADFVDKVPATVYKDAR